MKLYLATSNAGKVREFSHLDVELLPGLKDLPVAPETGDTFAANAIQKALYYGPHAASWLIAEDSGLEIDALNGAPGVHSARWAGNDAANNARLVREMAGQTVRAARYVCVIALVDRDKILATFHGVVEGEIVQEPQGEGGFGYDAYFFYPPFDATFAQISKDRKSAISHRGQAIEKLSAWLRENAAT